MEFMAILKRCTQGGKGKFSTYLDPAKVAALDQDEKDLIVTPLSKARVPIMREFVTPNSEVHKHLESLGYLHHTTNKRTGLSFIHTSENKPQED